MYSSGVSLFFHSSSDRPIGFFTRVSPSAGRSANLGTSGLEASLLEDSAGGASGFGAQEIPRARSALRTVVFIIIILGTRESRDGFYQNARGKVSMRPVEEILNRRSGAAPVPARGPPLRGGSGYNEGTHAAPGPGWTPSMKTPEDDFFLGRTVLEQRSVSREALLECLFQMAQERKAGVPRPLGVLLVARGHLTQEDLDGILASRVTAAGAHSTLSEAEVGRLLVAAGLISQENVEECVRLQEDLRGAAKVAPPLGELVVHRGYVTEGQVNRVLAYQRKVLFACASCGVRVSAVPPPPGSRYRCKKCQGLMSAVGAPAAPAAPD